jgi:hypothetical protein
VHQQGGGAGGCQGNGGTNLTSEMEKDKIEYLKIMRRSILHVIIDLIIVSLPMSNWSTWYLQYIFNIPSPEWVDAFSH